MKHKADSWDSDLSHITVVPQHDSSTQWLDAPAIQYNMQAFKNDIKGWEIETREGVWSLLYKKLLAGGPNYDPWMG